MTFLKEKYFFDKITAFVSLTLQTLVNNMALLCWGSWVGMGQGVGTVTGHGGIIFVLQTQFSSFKTTAALV